MCIYPMRLWCRTGLPMLISEPYRALNAKHHHEAQEWGLQSIKYWKIIKNLCTDMGLERLLDYGCGKRALERALLPYGIKVTNYDPAFPEYADSPEPHELVVCTDVLEHVEPECLEAVLDDLQRVIVRTGFFIVATRASLKNLPDGTNPHRIIETSDWWLEKLGSRFEVIHFDPGSEKYFMMVVNPK